MAFKDSIHRALVYFGLAEDRAYREPDEDVNYPEPEAELEDRYRDRPNVRRLNTRRRRDEIDDIFADDDDIGGRPPTVLPPAARGRPRNGTGGARADPPHPQTVKTAQPGAEPPYDTPPGGLNTPGGRNHP